MDSGSPGCSRVLTLRETPILSQSTPSGMGRPSSTTSGGSASVWPCPPWIPVTTAPQSAATGSRRGNRRDQDPRRVTRRTSFTALPIVTFNLEGKERPISADRKSQPAGAPRSNGASLSLVSQMWSSRIPSSYFPFSVKGTWISDTSSVLLFHLMCISQRDEMFAVSWNRWENSTCFQTASPLNSTKQSDPVASSFGWWWGWRWHV